MVIHLAWAALLIIGVLGASKNQKKKAAEKAEAEKAALVPKDPITCQSQRTKLGGNVICPDADKVEYDTAEDIHELAGDSQAEAQDECCKKWLTCAEYWGENSVPGGQMKTPGADLRQFKDRQHARNCYQNVPAHEFKKGSNWISHLNDAGSRNKDKVWQEISAHGQRWFQDSDGYWFRKCGDVWSKYISGSSSPGIAANCVIGLEKDGYTINHLGPFGREVSSGNMNEIFRGNSVTISSTWHPALRAFTKHVVGNAMDPNKNRGIILAVLIVGLSAALYMMYKCTRKTNGHYAKLLDEEV